MTSPNSSEGSNPHQETLSALETLRLGAAHAYYSVSRALRFDKVASLLQRAELSLDLPVALLGRVYNPAAHDNNDNNEAAAREVLSHLVHHFHSTPWMTYRSDFPPLPAGENNKTLLKSDAGWGCTLRSIQMIAAQTMVRHLLGSDWRWPLDKDFNHVPPVEMATNLIEKSARETTATTTTAAAAANEDKEAPSGLVEVLKMFWDVPEKSSPFSIHNLCYYGADCGVFPGRWLGPSTGCRALESAASAASSEQLQHLKIAVVGGTGGGAPVLGIDRYVSYFEDTNTEDTCNNTSNSASAGLLLLIPLVLGIGKLNPVYFPQLHAVLSMPHSVGIVGGRPGSSVYVIGCQGESLLYLDPHTIQPAACSESDWETFSCDVLRTLWLSSLDPSLALGFYCKDKEEYVELCRLLKELEEGNSGMPLVCVREGVGEDYNGEGGGEGNGQPHDWEEDELEETSDSVDDQEEESFDKDDEDEERFDDEVKEVEVERRDSDFSVVQSVAGMSSGGAGLPVEVGKEEEEEEEEKEEEEMQRRLSELRQQSSTKSAWELV